MMLVPPLGITLNGEGGRVGVFGDLDVVDGPACGPGEEVDGLDDVGVAGIPLAPLPRNGSPDAGDGDDGCA